MAQHTNFDNVQVGDLVKYYSGGWFGRTVVGKVTKVTPSQFCVGNDRFRKSDGKQIGENYRYCEPATAEDLQRQQAQQYKSRLQNHIINWFQDSNNTSRLTVAQLEAIQAIINQTDTEQ